MGSAIGSALRPLAGRREVLLGSLQFFLAAHTQPKVVNKIQSKHDLIVDHKLLFCATDRLSSTPADPVFLAVNLTMIWPILSILDLTA